MAVEEASFKTVIDSISSWLIKLRALFGAEAPIPPIPALPAETFPPAKGTPSTTINGSLPALTEELPRTLMFIPPPGSPLLWEI